jgi:hypothetical protein
MKNKFELNEAKDALIIDDNYRRATFLLGLVMFLHVITAMIYIYKANFTFTDGITQVYTLTGVISLIALVLFRLKRSADKEIPLIKINNLKIRDILGGQRYTIKLKDGKRRDINVDIQTHFKEFESLKLLLTENNIPIY